MYQGEVAILRPPQISVLSVPTTSIRTACVQAGPSTGRSNRSLIGAQGPQDVAGARLAKDEPATTHRRPRGGRSIGPTGARRRHPPSMPANTAFETMLAMTARTISRQPSTATMASVIESRAVERVMASISVRPDSPATSVQPPAAQPCLGRGQRQQHARVQNSEHQRRP